MNLAQVINLLGGTQQKVAERLGCSQPTVSGWVRQGYIPLSAQYRIQVETAGALKADPETTVRPYSKTDKTNGVLPPTTSVKVAPEPSPVEVLHADPLRAADDRRDKDRADHDRRIAPRNKTQRR